MTGFESNHAAKHQPALWGERLRLAEAASGIGAFEFDPSPSNGNGPRRLRRCSALTSTTAPANFEEWQRTVFVDDRPKIRAALEAAKDSGTFYVEFRVKQADGRLHWLAGKGQSPRQGSRARCSGDVLRDRRAQAA